MDRFKEYRNFMKSNFHEEVISDQQKQLPQPPLVKPYNEEDELIDLPEVDRGIVIKKDIYDCIMDRVSHRKYEDKPLRLEELSYLLYLTQGVKSIRGNNYATMRPVPSAGARHPYETYLAVNNVEAYCSKFTGFCPAFYSHHAVFCVNSNYNAVLKSF